LESAKRIVLKLAKPDSSPHAVLLYGAEGSGKTELANALAQAWLCTKPTEDGACGECQACSAFERDKSADFLHIAPAQPSNIIRLAAMIQMRVEDEAYQTPLLDFFRTPPLMARKKVTIIRDADRMNDSTANAFLKTLEEPGDYAKIILTTSNIGAVLPTIISRCLSVACELPLPGSKAEAMEILSENAPGRRVHIEQHKEAYLAIHAIAANLHNEPAIRALALAEEFRNAADLLEKSLHSNARTANVEALRAFGTCIAEVHRNPEWMSEIAEAHRRIVGNGSAGLVIDAMFARMLAL
jgi:DNA polymerase-3 subunit delta'